MVKKKNKLVDRNKTNRQKPPKAMQKQKEENYSLLPTSKQCLVTPWEARPEYTKKVYSDIRRYQSTPKKVYFRYLKISEDRYLHGQSPLFSFPFPSFYC